MAISDGTAWLVAPSGDGAEDAEVLKIIPWQKAADNGQIIIHPQWEKPMIDTQIIEGRYCFV